MLIEVASSYWNTQFAGVVGGSSQVFVSIFGWLQT